MLISRIDPVSPGKALDRVMDSLVPQTIGSVNWQEYPYAPEVRFTIAHDSERLYIKYYVREQASMARVTEDNGEVWTDSCVEFFIAFDDSGYYNFEFNCIGTALLAFRKEKNNARHAGHTILDAIGRYPSLPQEPFDETATDKNEWQLGIVIPKASFFMHSFENLNGVQASANFYKCGDHLSVPHFLSWNPIFTETPNFHIPQYFGKVVFE